MREHEVLITSFAKLIAGIIELPNELEVCLYPLDPSLYGGVDMNRVNRIFMSTLLRYEEIPRILTHELIHVNQKHLNLLSITPKGVCYWRGVPYTNKSPDEMTYEEYRNLPWEVDVQNRETKLLSDALQKYNTRS